MNRRTVNMILNLFAFLFVIASIGMVVLLLAGDLPVSRKTSLLIQSGILLMCSIWLYVIIHKMTGKRN